MAVPLKFPAMVETVEGTARSSSASRDGRQRSSGVGRAARRPAAARLRKNECKDGKDFNIRRSHSTGERAAVSKGRDRRTTPKHYRGRNGDRSDKPGPR